MIKKFTVDDIKEVTLAAQMINVEAVWCKIIFKGCVNSADFYASPQANNEFAQDMYNRLRANEFGDLRNDFSDFKTQPHQQNDVELQVISTRNRLLAESDYVELPSNLGRFSDEVNVAWATYRQSLRDLPSQQQFPWDPIWPEKP